MVMKIESNHYRWLNFIQFGKIVVSFCWFSITVLLYWHAPTFQVEQLYDCRWNLSYLLFSAVMGHVWLKSRTTLLYTAVYISNLYSIVYCFLSMVIYGIDTMLILSSSSHSEKDDINGYVKLSVSMLVLSTFGLGMTIFHFYRIFQVGYEQETKKQIKEQRQIQIFAAIHSALAIFTIYIAVELSPLKTWFLRGFVVREFACSLLTLSLAMVQILSFFFLNSVILKVLIFLNFCQFIQEMQMGIFSFYTFFYVTQLAGIVTVQNLMYHQVLVILDIIAHFCRIILCIWTIYLLAPYVYQKLLTLRIIRKIDESRLNAPTRLALLERQDNRWLIFLLVASLVTTIGHIFVIIAYILFGSISEELFTSTGIILVLSMLLFFSLLCYKKYIYRMAMIASLYCSINLIMMSCLFVLNFLYEKVFGGLILHQKTDFILNIFELAMAAITFWTSLFATRFGFRLVLETTVLHAQPQKISFWVIFLRWIALFTLLAAAIEFVLFLTIHLNADGHLASLTTSIQDWFLLASQGVLLYWSCKHERYQALITLIIFELTTIAVTSLDLLSQQTDLIQMMITLLFKPDQLSNINSDTRRFHANQYFVVLILHFVQIIQWFLSIFSLGICLYIGDNLVVDESNTSNDVHEISNVSNENTQLMMYNDGAADNPIVWSTNLQSAEVQISFENTVFQPDFNDPIAIQNLTY